MGQRGPKSTDELTVVPVGDRTRRPPPPPELSPDQAAEWRAITATLPPDWIRREHFPLLAAYCRHTCRARLLSAELDRFQVDWLRTDEGPERFDRLAKSAERETRAMLACARSLRLTHQSRYTPATAGRNARTPQARPPWEPAE